MQTVDGGYAGSVFAEDKSFTIGGGGDPDAFTDSNIALVGLDEGDAEWGDYDNDGDLDLLAYRHWQLRRYDAFVHQFRQIL